MLLLLLSNIVAHKVPQKLGTGSIVGLCDVSKLSLQVFIDSKCKSGVTHGCVLMCYTVIT